MKAILVSVVMAVLLTLCACQPALYNPDRATPPYPDELHRPESVDVQVFRDGTKIELVNATAHSYRDFNLWINQRYVAPVQSLPAGETIRLSLWNFYDQWGESINAGGLFRIDEPTSIWLVEIQPGESEQMIGLVTIRSDL